MLFGEKLTKKLKLQRPRSGVLLVLMRALMCLLVLVLAAMVTMVRDMVCCTDITALTRVLPRLHIR